jgi:hypothetical protein
MKPAQRRWNAPDLLVLPSYQLRDQLFVRGFEPVAVRVTTAIIHGATSSRCSESMFAEPPSPDGLGGSEEEVLTECW